MFPKKQYNVSATSFPHNENVFRGCRKCPGRNRSKIWASRNNREEGAQSLNFLLLFWRVDQKRTCLPEIVPSGHAEGEERKCLYVYVSTVKKWWVLLGRRKRVILICESCHFIGGVSIFLHYGMFILILRDFCKVHSPGFSPLSPAVKKLLIFYSVVFMRLYSMVVYLRGAASDYKWTGSPLFNVARASWIAVFCFSCSILSEQQTGSIFLAYTSHTYTHIQ